ncbi:MAG TPA: ATP-binding protein [Labilithrix sp.]|nr:ATP-binding protein [Labilithrix sp.]
MCIGRSPSETLEIITDALPTALSCEFVYITLPDGKERSSLRGAPVAADVLVALTQALARDPNASTAIELGASGKLRFVAVDMPLGRRYGRLVVGKSTPFEPDTERMLLRSAANLVGTTIETANVLEAAKRKDEFLAMLGHELRNPLAPILTAVEILARRTEATREREVIERNARHLARLVDDLLDISRVTCGHIELRHEPVTLNGILERGVELASPLLTRNRHELVRSYASDVTLQGDPVRLAQVFGNILTNAAKFTPADGRIELATEPLGDRVRVTVRDNGRGIAREKLAHIFEPFVQIDRFTDAARGGLGLGLAIVKNLVEMHDGTITATSDGPGTGSTFCVELPVPQVTIKPTESARQLPVTRRGMRVLVVDDNTDVAELLSEALQMRGFDTTVAFDGHKAMENWRTFAPHAAILDVGLPDVDGYDLARAIRAQHGKEPMLIAATGYGQPSDRLRAADAGFDCHFVKPVSVEELVRALAARAFDATG